MQYISRIGVLKDIPPALVLSIFLAGVLVGFLATVAVILVIMSGREKAGAEQKDEQAGEKKDEEKKADEQQQQEATHDVIMSIKRRVNGEGEEGEVGAGRVILQYLLYLVIFILLLLAIFTIVAVGRFLSEGRPRGEEFIPFIIRIFLFPLLEKFPALSRLLGQ